MRDAETTIALEFADFRLRPAARELLHGGERVKIGGRAFDILRCLVERGGELVDKRDLIKAAWPDVQVDEGNLRVHMTTIRRMFGDHDDYADAISNIAGRGYRFSLPVRVVPDHAAFDLSAETLRFERGAGAPSALHQLVGRTELIDRLVAQIAPKTVITLAGPGGIGKTSVAIRAAELWRDSHKREVEFIDLSVATDGAHVNAIAALTLGVQLTNQDALTQIIAKLSGRTCLLVIDNCEHVLIPAARLVEAVLRHTDIPVLATSREPLRCDGESVRRLAPLDFPTRDGVHTVQEAIRYEAVQLFMQRVRGVACDFSLEDADAGAIAAICRRLDGNPLAIELAAARAGDIGARSLLVGLDRRFDLLSRGKRTASSRQFTLKGAIDWSYDLLAPEEQRVLRQVSVFASSFTLDAASGVVDLSGSDKIALLDIIACLVAKSLVVVDATGETPRYRLLESMRAYGLERMVEAQEAHAVQRAHAAYMIALLAESQIDWTRPPSMEQRRGLTALVDDVRKALDWAFSPLGEPRLGVALTAASAPLWQHLLLLFEFQSRIKTALGHLDRDDPLTAQHELKLQTSIALLMFSLECSLEEMAIASRRALDLARAGGLVAAQFTPLQCLTNAYILSADHARAHHYACEFLAVAKTQAEPAFIRSGHRLMALHLSNLGRHGEALSHCRIALENTSTGLDHRLFMVTHAASSFSTVSRALWQLGKPDQAIEAMSQSAEAAVAANHPLGVCQALVSSVALVALWSGELDKAADYIELIRSTSERHHFPRWLGWGACYEVALRRLAIAPTDPLAPRSVDVSPPSLLQAENMAVCHPSLVGPMAIGIAERNPDLWCAPEIFRAMAEQVMAEREEGWIDRAQALIDRSAMIAERQDALSWRLRTAISAARLQLLCGRRRAVTAVLEPVYERFTEGFDTRDLINARRMLALADA